MTDKEITEAGATAEQLVDQMAADPTLDEFFNRNPSALTDADLDWFIERERARRAEFITKDANK